MILTLGTPVANDVKATFSVTIQDVLVKGSYTDKVAYYAGSVTVADTTAPEIATIVSKTNGEIAKSVVVTFSEPVTTPTVKIDGSTVKAKISADGYTATIEDVELDATKEHTLAIVNLTDLSGNVNENTSKKFSITKDTSAAAYTLSTKSDNKIVLTYDKEMDVDTVTAGVVVKGEDLNDLAGGSYTIGNPSDDKKTFVVTISANPFTAEKKSYKYTVMTKDTVKDSLGNASAATTTTATLSEDKVAPTIDSVSYVKNSDGEVIKILVKYNEEVTSETSKTLKIVSTIDGSAADTITTDGTVDKVLSDGKTVEYTTAANLELDGDYELQFTEGLVKDTAHATTKNKATKKVVNFGDGTAAKLKVKSASATNNDVTVIFDGTVTYSSATNPANYTIDGVALPADTTITLGDDAGTNNKVTFTLPANFVAKNDTGAVLKVANVQTVTGTKVSANQTVIPVLDNTSSTIVKSASSVTSGGDLVIGFDEAVDAGSSPLADLVIKLNGKTVATDGTTLGTDLADITVEAGKGNDEGKLVLTFNATYEETTATSGQADGTGVVFFDVDGDGTFDDAKDIKIQAYTAMTAAEQNALSNDAGTYNLNKATSIVVGTTEAPASITDASGQSNLVKADQSVTIK